LVDLEASDLLQRSPEAFEPCGGEDPVDSVEPLFDAESCGRLGVPPRKAALCVTFIIQTRWTKRATTGWVVLWGPSLVGGVGFVIGLSFLILATERGESFQPARVKMLATMSSPPKPKPVMSWTVLRATSARRVTGGVRRTVVPTVLAAGSACLSQLRIV
jgi:hypothetical protein